MRAVMLGLILGIGLSGIAKADHGIENIRFHRISPNPNAAKTQVTGIAVDQQGFVWILGTEHVYRFDGQSFYVFAKAHRATTRINFHTTTKVIHASTRTAGCGCRARIPASRSSIRGKKPLHSIVPIVPNRIG